MTYLSPLQKFVELLKGMFSRAEYHFPVLAAQNQYRERYYGLSSAAMLEDLFFDALSNYVRTYDPSSRLSRPPRGEKGYDYEFNGQKISHKVSKAGPCVIAALWDATRTDVTHWTFQTPISFTTGNYSSATMPAKVFSTGDTFFDREKFEDTVSIKPVGRCESLKQDEAVIVCHFGCDTKIKILHVWHPGKSGPINEILPFGDVWKILGPVINSGTAANEIEMFVISKKTAKWIFPDVVLEASSSNYRPGTYVIAQELLQNVALTSNNRALLIPKTSVATFLDQSVRSGNFVPMANWFSLYASKNPPDLYLVQKTEYDALFSAAGRNTNAPSARAIAE